MENLKPCPFCGKMQSRHGTGEITMTALRRTEKEADELHDFIVAQVKKHRGME